VLVILIPLSFGVVDSSEINSSLTSSTLNFDQIPHLGGWHKVA
jgi:hypothetical protein